jgi:hypothetical protein
MKYIDYTVSRVTQSVVEFVKSTSVSATLTVPMHIQPADGEDLINLPEGKRCDKYYWALSLTSLYVSNGVTEDIISIESENYIVLNKQNWTSQSDNLEHYEYILGLKPTV